MYSVDESVKDCVSKCGLFCRAAGTVEDIKMLRDHLHWCNHQDRRTASLDLPRQTQSMWKNSRSLQLDLNRDRQVILKSVTNSA